MNQVITHDGNQITDKNYINCSGSSEINTYNDSNIHDKKQRYIRSLINFYMAFLLERYKAKFTIMLLNELYGINKINEMNTEELIREGIKSRNGMLISGYISGVINILRITKIHIYNPIIFYWIKLYLGH